MLEKECRRAGGEKREGSIRVPECREGTGVEMQDARFPMCTPYFVHTYIAGTYSVLRDDNVHMLSRCRESSTLFLLTIHREGRLAGKGGRRQDGDQAT